MGATSGLDWKHLSTRPVLTQPVTTCGTVLTLDQCVLSMSDLQIITGIAILISGFASLHLSLPLANGCVSGLVLKHYPSALTFLRNYLRNHPGERLWRLICMFLFLCMLITAIVPTGDFGWLYNTDGFTYTTASDYAVCSIQDPWFENSAAYGSMIVSILLLIFSFATRVIKLYKPLSDLVVVRLRAYLSAAYRELLRKVYIWSGTDTDPKNWKRTCISASFCGIRHCPIVARHLFIDSF